MINLNELKLSGWKPDVPDFRDIKYSVPAYIEPTGSMVDLRHEFTDCYNQLRTNSCTANAIAAGVEYDRVLQKEDMMTPSRLFIYYNERKMQGWENQDGGAYIRDGIKSTAVDGYCNELTWPFDENNVLTRPNSASYAEAVRFKALQYARLDNTNLEILKGCLRDEYPFVFGVSLYESFMSQTVARRGLVPMPSQGEKMIGGHAMLCVGFIDAINAFIVRNSWSPKWGDNGYCYIPYEYMTHPDLGADYWTIRVIQ